MLSIRGEVWSLLSQATVAPERPIARVPAVWWVTDIGAAGNREWNRILISANSANSSKGEVKQTFLEVLSLSGLSLRRITGPPNGYYSGIAVDPIAKVAYVV